MTSLFNIYVWLDEKVLFDWKENNAEVYSKFKQEFEDQHTYLRTVLQERWNAQEMLFIPIPIV